MAQVGGFLKSIPKRVYYLAWQGFCHPHNSRSRHSRDIYHFPSRSMLIAPKGWEPPPPRYPLQLILRLGGIHHEGIHPFPCLAEPRPPHPDHRPHVTATSQQLPSLSAFPNDDSHPQLSLVRRSSRNARNMATLSEIELRLKSVRNIEKIIKTVRLT